jgi:uncharacterized protein YndB with AHSA1/START domain
MSANTRLVHATPEDVWEVLADGWLYPLWVVGASRMRDVDESWPELGSRIQHSVGVWPALIDDHTRVLEVTPGHHLKLRARGWPLGEADVDLTLEAQGAETLVTIREDAVAGPGVLVPEPIKGLGIKWRNTETLHRLALIAENRP